ncbi:hypothetical protein [Jeotgalibacillus sp. JSM ZJ347]|uniref:hypothetical protein n=1 Tax=Jeotgalibacillus sp. JSM ZJ347 TaxID=3342117 RepID=UPI0035A973F1
MPEIILLSAVALFIFHMVFMLKRKVIVAERFSNTVVGIIAGGAGLTAALPFFMTFNGEYLWILALLIPAGYTYGFQTGYASAAVAGALHISIGSAMGLMLGEVMQSPALCGLPIQEWQMMLPIFSMMYFMLVSVLVVLSFRY